MFENNYTDLQNKNSTELRKRIHEYFVSRKEAMIENLKSIVRIPSEKGEAKPGMPFGEECFKALKKAEELYLQNGFDTELDFEGKYLLSYFGNGKKSIGFFSHSDVVAHGDGWIYTSPFEPIEKDGFLIGRGVLDDKAAVVISLYAAKAIKELEIPFSSRLVMFTGSNEESGMDDIKSYVKKNTPPDFSLVSDTGFPCFRGDKGRTIFNAVGMRDLAQITEFKGGQLKGGSVAGNAEAKIKYSNELYFELKALQSERLKISCDDEFILLNSIGIPKHSALPEGSLNAVFLIADALSACKNLCNSDRKQMKFVADMTRDYYGEYLQIENFDPEFGRLTCTNFYAGLDDGKITLAFNIRYGLAADSEKFLKTIKTILNKNDFTMKDISSVLPSCIPADNRFVVGLLETYKEYTGEKDACAYINAGGTYARELPLAVKIGPQFWKKVPFLVPEGHGNVHQPDELLSIDGFLEAAELTTLMILKCDDLLNEK